MSDRAGGCAPDGHGHCSLCGDEAIAGVVVALDVGAAEAVLRTDAGTLTVALDLVVDVQPGDQLLVHQGFAIARVT